MASNLHITDWTSLENSLRNDGGVIVPDCLDWERLTDIRRELAPWLNTINFNDTYGSTIRGKSQWIDHVGIASRSAVALALDENILDLVDNFFGEECVLAEFSLQKKIAPDQHHLKFHSDGAGGIILFVYLTEVNSSNGGTRILPKTHKIGLTLQSDPKSILIEPQHYQKYLPDLQAVEGGPGTILLFHQDIWHDLPPFSKAGREVLWLVYHPARLHKQVMDHLYRQNHIHFLNDRQRRAYGLTTSQCFGREGYFRNIGRKISRSDIGWLLRYWLNNRKAN